MAPEKVAELKLAPVEKFAQQKLVRSPENAVSKKLVTFAENVARSKLVRPPENVA